MIKYETCSNVSLDTIYKAFKIGYSDYIVKCEMSKEEFASRFFGPEGNDLNYSFIALNEDQPIGLALGGIRSYEGILTLRCGSLCIDPEYRGKGVSQELFKRHREIANLNGCKQLFLEVIATNHRAINFYKKLGYEAQYEIHYYSHMYPQSLKPTQFIPKAISKDEFMSIKDKFYDLHVNWQNDFDFIDLLKDVYFYGHYKDSKLISALALSKNGKVLIIWTDPAYRCNGFGKALLSHAAYELALPKISINFSNSSNLNAFVKKLSFKEEDLYQFEMYQLIN